MFPEICYKGLTMFKDITKHTLNEKMAVHFASGSKRYELIFKCENVVLLFEYGSLLPLNCRNVTTQPKNRIILVLLFLFFRQASLFLKSSGLQMA